MTNSIDHRWLWRQKLKSALRQFFDNQDYIEVETPHLVRQPGVEAHIDYFATCYQDWYSKSSPLFLRSSPELAMKQLMASGIGPGIYQIATCFRNGGETSPWHHPEFTMIEWYDNRLSVAQLMNQTEDLLRFTEQQFVRQFKITPILPKTCHYITVGQAFDEFVGIDLIDNDPELAAKSLARGWHSPLPDDDFETVFFKLMIEVIEPAFKQRGLVCLHEYPKSQGILAKNKGDVALRFEFYLQGVELCNGFEELADSQENFDRLTKVNSHRQQMNKPALARDQDYYDCFAKGFPECSGNALGFDRWLMLLVNAKHINQIIPVPMAINHLS